MPKVMSDKQLAANRRNAQKSTGPRTADGKARSARNNTRHGLFSRSLVLQVGPTAEDPAELDALRCDLLADFNPVTAAERQLVDRLVRCFWLTRRTQRFESRALAQVDQKSTALRSDCDFLNHSSFLAMIRLENRVNRELHHALERLRARREVRRSGLLAERKNDNSKPCFNATSMPPERAGRTRNPDAIIWDSKNRGQRRPGNHEPTNS